jgi:cysteine desulfurase family protein (TIGR01976 family)
MTAFDPQQVRARFPALAREVGGRPVLYLDGPGGTQAPRAVGEAMSEYLASHNANYGGRFAASRETTELVAATRTAAAAFLGADPGEIAFGQNMTSVTFAASRAISRGWKPGDEVIVTTLDHDANVAPWLQAAEDRGALVRTLRLTLPDCALLPARLAELLTPRTRLVALPWASNAVGTIPDLAKLVAIARAAGALTYVDAVHYAPHAPIDVRAIGCDFLACSAYKFCGPHLGILHGRRDLLETLKPYKVRPASDAAPGKWETGTQNFEAMAGLRACLAYFGELGAENGDAPLSRPALSRAMTRIRAYEQELTRRFLAGAAGIRGVTVHGIADPARAAERTPTFGITIARLSPREANDRLAARGVFAWDGHFYAVGVADELGLAASGGLLRLGFAHYNTLAEVDRILEELQALAAGR